ncbi:MAG: YIP1 family protein [Candidatus Methylomirabilia bacterium]
MFCPHCGARIAAVDPVPTSPVAAGPDSGAWNNPWEQRAGRGPVAAFAETLQQTLFRPVAFFRGTARDRGAGAALLYAVLVGTLSIAVAFLWQRALGEHISAGFGGRYFDFFGRMPILAGLSVFLPLGVALGTIIWAAVLHVSLAVLGGARGTFTATFKAVCYSSSATAFNVFPVCGAAIGAVWQVVVQVIGLRELHRTSTARAFWAWFLPFVVAICLTAALLFAAMFGLLKFWQEFSGGKFEV